jgi:magnesium-transporting ATPase (P-type)
MRLSGMNFFILTGDKRETAINIGRSCGLIDPKAELVDIPMYDQMESHEWRAEMLRIKEIKSEKVYLLNA